MLPKCQHTACWPCWQKVETGLCPYCRTSFQARDLVLCRYLAGSLAEARVRCPFSCGWVGGHQMLAGHEASCPILNVAALQGEVKARDDIIGKLQKDVATKDTEILALKAALRWKDADIHLLERAVAGARANLHARLELVRIACVEPIAARTGRRRLRILSGRMSSGTHSSPRGTTPAGSPCRSRSPRSPQ